LQASLLPAFRSCRAVTATTFAAIVRYLEDQLRPRTTGAGHAAIPGLAVAPHVHLYNHEAIIVLMIPWLRRRPNKSDFGLRSRADRSPGGDIAPDEAWDWYRWFSAVNVNCCTQFERYEPATGMGAAKSRDFKLPSMDLQSSHLMSL